jgi:hypothetical protein
VTVLANQDASDASAAISRRIAALLFDERDAKGASESRARRILESLQHGKIDRSLLTDNANSYFTGQALEDFATSLAPLGPPKQLEQTRRRERGGMTFRHVEAKFPEQTRQTGTRHATARSSSSR